MNEKREITEILTIYRRMKKGRNQDLYHTLTNSYDEIADNNKVKSDFITCDKNIGCGSIGNYSMYNDPETGDPNFLPGEENGSNHLYDFGQFKVDESKFILYSKESNLLQCEEWPAVESCKYYWLNIFNPTEVDLQVLRQLYNVHDITLNDIREKNTEEKIEVFRHYTFISTKLFESGAETTDIDFNILMFKDYIITTHDKPWASISDIVNFLYLISQHTTIYPDWVFYSIIIEFLQDVKHMMRELLPKIHQVQEISANANLEIEKVLRDNFELVYRLYDMRRFCKPKIAIISSLKTKHAKRMRKNINDHLLFALSEFYGIDREAKEANVILERCQDLFLALVNLEHSREANEMNKAMHQLTIVTFIFLPVQAVAGLWGMNVKVPFQDENNLFWFWFLTLISPLLGCIYFVIPRIQKLIRRISCRGDVKIRK
ncbi:putative metal ion transporter C17A12.14 [Dictyocoela roeselum]|nr:putative metal ion transporter C17A12.14 [Dictyocoela roeselum]